MAVKRGTCRFPTEEQGFEPWRPFRAYRFSRPAHSTALPLLPKCRHYSRGGGRRHTVVQAEVIRRVGALIRRTFRACRPLAPSDGSYSTSSPSFNDRNPLPSMLVKCTNTSLPSGLTRNPNPFLTSNHFTVPIMGPPGQKTNRR